VAGRVPQLHAGARAFSERSVGAAWVPCHAPAVCRRGRAVLDVFSGWQAASLVQGRGPRKRRGKERDKLAIKLEALADVCDAESRARLLGLLADPTGVTFSSELLRAVCEIVGIRNAFTSFEYLLRGERKGLDITGEPLLVPAEAPTRYGG
jgi:hypothetical protein